MFREIVMWVIVFPIVFLLWAGVVSVIAQVYKGWNE